ncbi:hypothetical protein [Rickettsiella massiliensis]|uniref:hypothetical protein n=1 Tax=Rickettsiella massiliensis TaxID=676517 RepID=UPI00178C6ACE|nr:hypothetical protein [Rickettsiella massiliensis]
MRSRRARERRTLTAKQEARRAVESICGSEVRTQLRMGLTLYYSIHYSYRYSIKAQRQ